MQNIKKRTFWLLAIIGLLFVITGCSKSGNDDLEKMKISFANTSYESRLLKITTNKGEVYYGGKGIIFDGNYNPLLLCTLKARRVVTEKEKYTAYYRPVCYVSPRVFEEPNTIVNKGIIKKLIPFYTSHNMDFPLGLFRDKAEDRKVQVVIDNFDRFFVKPVKPSPSTCSNELLNQCLIDNIEDIMMLI